MRKRRFISLTMVAVLLSGIFMVGPFSTIPVNAATATDLANQIDSIPGLSATLAPGNEVLVTGSANVTSNMNLHIDSGVKIRWAAELTGSATANNYLLTLSGGGEFTLTDKKISATSGAGGSIYIAGGITLNVKGGLIESPGSGSAVTIAAGTLGAVINVSGGTIRSIPNGYAINDGAGMVASDNNTQINITGGLIEASAACAIRSTGIASIVTVGGGEVRNSAASNTNSTIYMNYAPAPNDNRTNIIVKGGLVRTTHTGNQSYVVQSSQNVRIEGGEVQALAGRAINLVGDYSVAAITGGRVSTQTGTAVCTATTTLDDVDYASIVISGGIVEATGNMDATPADTSGTAVKITGNDSTVTISGDAWVLAKSGLAIDASGRPKDNSVKVEGGLVFAWGNAINKTISPLRAFDTATNSGYIAAWNTATGIATYHEHESTDLSLSSLGTAVWDNDPLQPTETHGGVFFQGSNPAQVFLPLHVNDSVKGARGKVDVINETYDLYVDDGSGAVLKGSYKVGETVIINARPDHVPATGMNPNTTPTNGDRFREWSTNAGGFFQDKDARDTTFTMPANTVTVTANFNPRYRLHVEGMGSIIADLSQRNFGNSASYGYFAEGEVIIISASYAFSIMVFDHWGSTAGEIGRTNSLITTFTMPGEPATVTAWTHAGSSHTPTLYKTTVEHGKITGTTLHTFSDSVTEYTAMAGTSLRMEAVNPDPENLDFNYWEIKSGSKGVFENSHSENTVFYMPDEDVIIEAIYETRYTLTVVAGTLADGTSSGKFKVGERVVITAREDTPVDISKPDTELINGDKFKDWSSSAGGSFQNSSAKETIFTMPANNADVTANFDLRHRLFVSGGINGDAEIVAEDRNYGGNGNYGYYIAGETVYMNTGFTDGTNRFNKWECSYPPIGTFGQFGNEYSLKTSFIMPNNTADVEATLAPYSPNGDSTTTVLNGEIINYTDINGNTSDPPNKNEHTDKEGTALHITTGIPEGQAFVGWIFSSGSSGWFENADSPTTTFYMGNTDVTIRAQFEDLFSLTVINGTIEGGIRQNYYRANEIVTIIAREDTQPDTGLNPADHLTNGDRFTNWTADSSLATIHDSISKTTMIQMPEQAVIITANFNPLYRLHVTDGLGGNIDETDRIFNGSANYGYYAEGDMVKICAVYQMGKNIFKEWNIEDGDGILTNSKSLTTTFTMYAEHATVTARCMEGESPPPLTQYTTTIGDNEFGKSGTIEGILGQTPFPSPKPFQHTDVQGTGLFIKAENPDPDKYEFDRWVVACETGSNCGEDCECSTECNCDHWFLDASSPETVFVMPSKNVSITAYFKKAEIYTLQVIDDESGEVIYGTGTGTYHAGDLVPIVASTSPIGKVFESWKILSGSGDFDDVAEEVTVFHMPDTDTVITSHNEFLNYNLTLKNCVDSLGIGHYHYGERVTIEPRIPSGTEFVRWVIDGIALGDILSPTAFGDTTFSQFTFDMPANDVSITAEYRTVTSSPPTPAPTETEEIDPAKEEARLRPPYMGDNSSTVLLWVLLGVSGLGIVVLVIWRKRWGNKNSDS